MRRAPIQPQESPPLRFFAQTSSRSSWGMASGRRWALAHSPGVEIAVFDDGERANFLRGGENGRARCRRGMPS